MADTAYIARNRLPAFLTRARDNAIELRVYDPASGVEVAPSAGTISVFDSAGVAVVDEVAVTVANNYAEYTVLAAAIPVTLALSEYWQVRWTLTLSSVDHQFIQSAHLVRWGLANPVLADDVTEAHVDLADVLTTAQAQGYVTRAFQWLMRRLLQRGRLPWLVLDTHSLYDVVLYAALHLAFLDQHASVGGSGKYAEMADYYRSARDVEFAGLTLTYDSDEDGRPDEGEEGTAAIGSLFLGGPGNWGL